jgi:hypothetical protein
LHNQILHFKNLFVGAMGAIDAFMAQLQKVPNKTMRAAFRVMERGARQHLPCLDDPELGPTYLTFSGYQCVPCPALDLWEEQHGIEPHPNAPRLLVECAGRYFKNPGDLLNGGVTYYDTIQPYTQVAE